jgi:protein-S-isoprenylcysteine O-methyltransferase Ste14
MTLSLFFRNLFFTLLQPGLVAGFIPWYLLKDSWKGLVYRALDWNYFLGGGLALLGCCMLFYCIWNFAVVGRGTLSPADPTTTLVISGLYRYSRNPMYIGVLLMLTGEAIFSGAAVLGYYALFVFVLFHGFIILFEEPRLRRDFGAAYIAYCQKTRRWV